VILSNSIASKKLTIEKPLRDVDTHVLSNACE